jgi:uncharacterized phosphosugar-binding protein
MGKVEKSTAYRVLIGRKFVHTAALVVIYRKIDKKGAVRQSMENSQVSIESFWQEVSAILERVRQTQTEAIRQAAAIFADAIERDGVIQAYGTGHSRAFTMEMAGRAGGLVPVNRIDLEDLALYKQWPLERVVSPDIERDLEAGREILTCYPIEPQDAFIISSNSGINQAIIEVALHVKQHGHQLVAVTSLASSQQTASRHSSGHKLYELADVVIDSCIPYGDALLEMPNGGKACAGSSMSGALIAQMLTAETIRLLLARGKEAPVYISSNVPGGIENNQRLVQHYGKRIRPV